MTPESWAAIGSIVERYGLPLSMLAGFVWAILRRKFVTGAEADGWKALYERERQDRIAAESALLKFAPANAELAEGVAELSKNIVERLPKTSIYEERMEGRRGG